MKFLALFCLIGFAAASSSVLRWESGQEYVFEYNGRMLTGLPELNTHFSGLGMKCQVHLQVQGQNRFAIQVRDVKYSHVNEPLGPSNDGRGPMTGPSTTGGFSGSYEESNWRNVQLPTFVPVPTQTAEYLSQTTLFTVGEHGEVEGVTVSKNEPEWAVNFKKALVVIFQTKTGQGVNYESNTINGFGHEEPLVSGYKGEGESPIYGANSGYWRTTEESIDGRCTVSYQLNELPNYMAKDIKHIIEKPQMCGSEGKYFELIKTKDINSCSTRASFSFFKPGFFKCPAGNCDGMWSRSSMTKYIACGSSKTDLKIMTIVNDGELQQDLLGFKSEKFLTGTSQVLKLIHKQPISQAFPQPSNPASIPSLVYQYVMGENLVYPPTGPIVPEQEQYGHGILGGLSGEEKKIAEEELYKFIPKAILATGAQKPEGSASVDAKLIPQVKSLLQELVTEDLIKVNNNIPKKQITMKVLALSKAFSIMTKSGIETVYGELKGQFSGKEQTIFKNIFFDTVLMGGSVSDVLLIKEWIMNGEVTSKVQVATLLSSMPQYILFPTEKVLSELFELIKCERVSSHFILQSHAILSYTTLVEKACLSSNRMTTYPTFVYGPFCNPESEVVTGKLLPYLQEELKTTSSTEKKNLMIVALGQLSHKRVISILLPVLESTHTTTVSGSEGYGIGGVQPEAEEIETTGFTRYLAVYSLSKVGRKFPQMVTPVLMSVYLNRGETTEVRVAAFNCLLNLEPSTTVLQQIGTSTWTETDMEVLKTVNTAFYSLMKVQDIEMLTTSSANLCRKAALLYPLIKKTGGRFPTSATLFSSEYLRKLGVGYSTVHSWTSSSESFIPKNIYGKIVYYLDRYQVTSFEFGARFQGIENIINLIREASGEEGIYSGLRGQINGEIGKIVEELKIKTRGQSSTQGALYLSVFENMKTFLNFDILSEETLKEKIMPLIKNPQLIKEKLTGYGSGLLNFQRALDLANTDIMIPSDMGLPIIIETHMPITFSLTGDLNLETSAAIPAINMKVKALYVAQLTGWVGTTCPFTKDSLVTVIDEHTVLNVPAEFTVGVNVPEGKLKVVIKPFENISGPVDMIHYHVLPYTVRQSFWNMKPYLQGGHVNTIKSRSPMIEKTLPFGEEYLGLSLKTVIKSETPIMDKTTLLQKLSLYNYNPVNMFRFFWSSTSLSEQGNPSLRSHELKVLFEPSQSMTKEIEFNFKIGVATKEAGKGIKYHKLTVVEGKPIIPYKVHSESLESVSGGHSERSNKLQQALQKIGDIKYGTGVCIYYSIALRGGSRPKTYTQSITITTGTKPTSSASMEQKWNVHFECENSGKKLCIRGDVQMPLLPTWNLNEILSTPINYHYNNFIGFGQTCEEHTMKITGNAQTTEQQKTYAKESPEAKLLAKLISQGVPLAKLSELSQKVRNQASKLDEIVFRNEYHNIPAKVMKVNDYAVEALKTLLFPYIQKVEGSMTPSEYNTPVTGTSTMKIFFHPERQTVDITLHRPTPGHQTIVFKNIRLPYPLTYVLPKVAGKPIIKSLEQTLRGVSVYPTCKLEGQYVQTFKNRTIEAKMDSCFHLFAADCGKMKEFAILVRSLSSTSGPKEVKVLLNAGRHTKTIKLTPTDRHSGYSTDIIASIEGEKINMTPKKVVLIEGPKTPFNPQGIYGKMTMSVDGVLRIKTSTFELLFNGDKLEVEGSDLFKGKVCGVCGDYANVKASDLRGPSKCVYSKSELLVASYRIRGEGQSCGSLPEHISNQLRKETQECAKIKVFPTKVLGKFGPYIPVAGSGSYGPSSYSYSGVTPEECTYHRNLILRESGKICFSRKPVIGCKSSLCRKSELVEKRVSFTCMEQSRAATHIEERILRGQTVPELEGMPVSFEHTQQLPRTCRPW